MEILDEGLSIMKSAKKLVEKVKCLKNNPNYHFGFLNLFKGTKKLIHDFI